MLPPAVFATPVYFFRPQRKLRGFLTGFAVSLRAPVRVPAPPAFKLLPVYLLYAPNRFRSRCRGLFSRRGGRGAPYCCVQWKGCCRNAASMSLIWFRLTVRTWNLNCPYWNSPARAHHQPSSARRPGLAMFHPDESLSHT